MFSIFGGLHLYPYTVQGQERASSVQSTSLVSSCPLEKELKNFFSSPMSPPVLTVIISFSNAWYHCWTWVAQPSLRKGIRQSWRRVEAWKTAISKLWEGFYFLNSWRLEFPFGAHDSFIGGPIWVDVSVTQH